LEETQSYVQISMSTIFTVLELGADTGTDTYVSPLTDPPKKDGYSHEFP
jgi:hypothetical protein